MFKVSDSNQTAGFYDRLMDQREQRGIFGKATRFNPSRIASLPSVQRHVVGVIRPLIQPTDRVLDFGCGPGSFLLLVAPMCREIVGCDISERFVESSREAVREAGLTNARVERSDPFAVPFPSNSFDVLLMVDVVHHMEDPSRALKEAFRILRPGGRAIIFEPNKLNPVLWLMCAFDRNEWGLLRLGSPRKYRGLFNHRLEDIRIEFNGVVIGPESRIWTWASDVMNAKFTKPFLGWLNPKILISGRKIQNES